jgi:hypothetical protein
MKGPKSLRDTLDALANEADRKWGPKPEHPYKAIVLGVTVYGGNDLDTAMAIFEAMADQAAIGVGAGMVMYMMPPFAVSHMAPGYEDRPVVEAHAATPSGARFVGALYGVSHEQWRSRPGI